MDQKTKAFCACIMMSSIVGCTETSSDNSGNNTEQNSTSSGSTESAIVTFEFDKDYVVTDETFEVSGYDNSKTCFWFIEESPEGSNPIVTKLTSSSDQMCKAEIKTDLSGLYTITLLGFNNNIETRVSNTVISGTLLDSKIIEDSNLILQESPYIIRSTHDFSQTNTTPEIENGVEVTIDSGVSIINDKYKDFHSAWPANLINRGTIVANGTDEHPVKIKGVKIENYANGTSPSLIFNFTEYSSQELSGKVEIHDSEIVIEGEKGITLFDDSIVKRTILDSSYKAKDGKISIASNNINFEHNTVATDSLIVNSENDNIIKHNDFTDVISVIGTTGLSGAIDLKENFWGTSDLAVIQRRFDDLRNNPDSNYLIEVNPPLLEKPILSP